MTAIQRHRRHGARPRRRAGDDHGFTLVEVVLSVVLSAILAGVVISILLTSMSVVDRTTEISHDATDAGLIAAFLYRDAQAAGGTDPVTLAEVAGLGVSTDDWGGCEQDGELVVRFAWIDRLDLAREHPMTVTWALSGDGVLNRRACQDGTSVDVALGEHVVSALASCLPGPRCDIATTKVSLDVTGSAQPDPVTFSLSASLRTEAPQATGPTGAAAPLLVFGGAGDCPELTLGTGPLHVLGNGVVDGACGPKAVVGDLDLVLPVGQMSYPSGTRDLYADLVPTAPTCTAATDPAFGASPSADATVVYTQPVVVSASATMQPGRYVFCQGLTVGDGVVLSGTDVMLQVVSGDVDVAAGARLALSAPTTGASANLLLTVERGDVTIADGVGPTVLDGVVHAAAGHVTLGSQSSVALGALVADRVTTIGTGSVRIGRPIPTITVEPIELAPAQVSAAYPSLAMIADGGTGPYSWRATGLPAGLSLTSGGLLTGTPTAAGSTTVRFTVTDATGLATVAERALTIKAPLSIAAPASLPNGQVGTAYSTSITASGGTSPYSFTAVGLPAGLTLAADGTLSGTPTTAGTATVVVTATDDIYAVSVRTYTLTVRAALAIASPSSLPNGTAGTAYTTTAVSASGGLAPYTYAAVGLPSGVTISAAGSISGTPAAAGTYTIDVTATDASGATATRTYTFSIIAAGSDAKPFARTARFQVLTEGDALLGTWEIEGSAGVGGNVTLRNYQKIATKELSTVTAHAGGAALGLLVGGQVDLTASGSGVELRVEEGWFVVGSAPNQSLLAFDDELHLVPAGVKDDSSTPRVRSRSSQTKLPTSAAIVPKAFPFADTFTELRSTSSRLATLAPATCAAIATPKVSVAFGNHTVTLSAGSVNVLNLTIAEMTAMNNVAGSVVPGPKTPLVINITDRGDVTLPVRYWDLLKDSGSTGWILWNFPNATTLRITQSFTGSLLAPNAAVTMTDVNVVGEVVTKTLDYRPWSSKIAHFDVTVPCLGGGAPYVATPGNLSSLQAGVAMTAATFTGGGGTTPYTWAASGLPAGLTMSSAGVLSGTPTTAGTSDVTVRVTDANGTTGSRVYRLIVNAAPSISGPASLPDGQVGVAYTSTPIVMTGGTSPFTWSASGLPAGLSITSAGAISGTPTAATSAGAVTVTVSGRDSAGVTATRTYTVFVAAAGVPAGCPLNPAGWRGEYYANTTLSGTPGLCRDDAEIAFNWGGRSPGGSIPGTNFSVRWTRSQSFAAGTYRFVAAADDGIRVYVDGTRVINDWVWQSYTADDEAVDVTLTAGFHTIVVEYFQAPGLAQVDVHWETSIPTPCGEATTGSWLGEYYSNRSLTGTPTMCRNDASINFDWGTGSPTGLPADRFSVRWTRVYDIATSGTYRVTAGSDDGVRVYLDGVRVIDYWADRSYSTNVVDVWVPAGQHTVSYEFYENGGFARATLTLVRR